MGKRIGILGGTFDPVHNGHITIADAFLNSGYIDELWVMPAPDPPHKQKQDISPFDIRVELLNIAFREKEKVYISDFEKSLEQPSYTLRTIRALKKKYPDFQFTLCLGSDSILDINNWFHSDELIKETNFLVAYRPGFIPDHLPTYIREKCQFVKHKPLDISSTELKESLKQGKIDNDNIPVAVLTEIRKRHLYQ